jgi:hypothetical protein
LLLLLADLHEQAFVDSQLLEAHVAALRAFPPSVGAHRKRAARKAGAAAKLASITSEITASALSLSDLEELSLLDFLPLLGSPFIIELLSLPIFFILAHYHFDVLSIVLQFKNPQFLFFLHLFVQFFLDIDISLS